MTYQSNLPLPGQPMPSVASQNFTVFVRPERAGDSTMYVAQCIEYDICVQGPTIDAIMQRFAKAVVGHIVICMRTGDVPFVCLPPGRP
jgi:hypothetical protein